MSVHIAGMGWVTPLGSGVKEVWELLMAGREALPETISDALSANSYPAFRVPKEALKGLPMHPRLRRASGISRYAAAAGISALRDAENELGPIDPARVALIFAISNGGVIYTKRFYHDVVATGAGSASPLLFPETVFNAPSSHLAAIVGVAGPSYTVVGDGAVGLSAIDMANDLLNNTDFDCCVVVGAEEVDWLLCDAYATWRLVRSAPPIEPFRQPPRGMIPSEGAGAVVLARKGAVRIRRTHPGAYYCNRNELAVQTERLVRDLEMSPPAKIVIGSANGTFIDAAEQAVVKKVAPESALYSAKPALGESVGASGLWQTIVAAMALLEKKLPPLLHAPAALSANIGPASSALVLTCGLNQQLSALTLYTA